MQNITALRNVLKAYDNPAGKVSDISLENGSVKEKNEAGSTEVQSVLFKNLIDFGTRISEPGFEHRETLEQTCEAAALGGFAAIMAFPTTGPAVDNQASVEFVTRRSGSYHGIKILQIGAISQGCEGKELAGILEMHSAGAVAFSDGQYPVRNGGLLMRAMDYLKGIGKTIIDTPFDVDIFPNGLVGEGAVSTLMGVPGIPAPAEEIIVYRDIQLAKYTGAKLHLFCISTGGSIELVRKAKADGVPVTASVSVNNLLFDVTEMLDYDSNLKVMPPLRERPVCDLLWEAVKDGTIDIISSQHMPYEVEKKDLEFQYASFGALGIQTAVTGLLTRFGTQAAPVIQQAMSERIIEVFGLQEAFSEDRFSCFEKVEDYIFEEKELKSNCYNSPFTGRELSYKIKSL